jgi:gamma-glutamyltranspeptidase / glutathione hydrolase
VSAAAASPHWAATRAGADVLAAGGSAMDAAVAINAMLTVVYPHMCGLAGDLFLLYRDAADGRVWALNGSGPAPRLATREAFRERGLSGVPARGPLPVTVPGAVAAWAAGLERFGRRPLDELLAPAARAAEEGVEVTDRLAGWIAHNAADLAADPVLRGRYLDGDGRAIAGGTTLRQPDVARTLRRIMDGGAGELYRGRLADEVDEAFRTAGGLLRREDLAAFAPEWVEPVRQGYRGLEVVTTPPNSQGVTALMMLGALTALEPGPPGTADHVEALIAAKRFAFAQRDRHVADPRFGAVPMDDLLSLDRARAALAGGSDPAPPPVRSSAGDTIYLCTVDSDGNACSLIESIYYGFGSCFVAGETGLLFHNRGHYFSLDAEHANRLEPGKRPLHTLMATMAFEGGDLRLVFGCMGADGQAQTTVQVLERRLAGGSVADAVSLPRILHGRFVPEDDPEALTIEEPFGDAVIGALRERGHQPIVVGEHDERLGHAHAIELRPDGALDAASDPRSDGAAIVLD